MSGNILPVLDQVVEGVVVGSYVHVIEPGTEPNSAVVLAVTVKPQGGAVSAAVS